MSNDRIADQNKEFQCVDELSKQWRRLQMTPVVDDDYPEVRNDYERALYKFIEALKVNRPTQVCQLKSVRDTFNRVSKREGFPERL